MTGGNRWPLVPLSELLTPVSRPVAVDPQEAYTLLGSRWYAKGLYPKERKLGSEIRASKLYRVQQNDFVYNRLFAWKGSFAVATDKNDGCFVSNEFPCFTANLDRLDPRFLWYHFSREASWNEALGLSHGATPTSRNRLKEEHFRRLHIPLPPLAEQRRIVAKIDSLAKKIEEAQNGTQQVESEWLALLRSRFSQIVDGAPRDKMGNAAPLIRRKVEPRLGEEYPELGIRSFGKGTFHKPSLDYLTVGTKKLYRIEPGDLVFNNVFAWEGAIAVSQPEDQGRVGSHRFITCVPQDGVVSADFLCFYFLTPDGLERIREASPGGAGRNRTLGLAKLAEIDVPVPRYDAQVSLGRLIQKVRAMQTVRDSARNELDALLPSILDRAFSGAL